MHIAPSTRVRNPVVLVPLIILAVPSLSAMHLSMFDQTNGSYPWRYCTIFLKEILLPKVLFFSAANKGASRTDLRSPDVFCRKQSLHIVPVENHSTNMTKWNFIQLYTFFHAKYSPHLRRSEIFQITNAYQRLFHIIKTVCREICLDQRF